MIHFSEEHHPPASREKSNPFPKSNIVNAIHHTPNMPNFKLETPGSPWSGAVKFLLPSYSSTALNGTHQNDVLGTTPNYDHLEPDLNNIDEHLDEEEPDDVKNLNGHRKVAPTESTIPLPGYDPVDGLHSADSGKSKTL